VGFRGEIFSTRVDQVIVVWVAAEKPCSISFAAKIAGVTNTKTHGADRHSH